MFLGRRRVLLALEAILMVFFLCSCDLGLGPAAPTHIPPILTPGPTNLAQAIASPTKGEQPSPAATSNGSSIEPASATQAQNTVAPTPTSQSIPIVGRAYPPCTADIRSGGDGRMWTDCWQGVVNGYEVLVKAGFNHSKPVQGCSEEGVYEIDARPLGSKDFTYRDAKGAWCGPLHIREISGSYIGFNSASVILPTTLPSGLVTTTPYLTLT